MAETYHVMDRAKPKEKGIYKVVCFYGGRIVRQKGVWDGAKWWKPENEHIRLRNVVLWIEESENV